jgi:carboxypeptidase PM20D1
MPPRETAAGILASAIETVERHPPARHLEGPVSALFDFVAPEMRWAPRLILSNLWLTAPLVEWQLERSPPTSAVLRTTLAVTMLQGSSKENVLPTRAVATLNIRIHPAERIETVLEHLARVVDDPRVRIERAGATVREPSALSPIDGEAFTLLQRTIQESFPDVVVAPGLVVGATDSRHYAGLSDAVYRFSPVRIGRADTVRIHGADERIAVKDYTEAVRFYARLIRNAAGPS